MKNQKGITLISLIITIIIILILADVVFSASTGKDGIIFKANFSTEEHKAGEAKEDMTLACFFIKKRDMPDNISRYSSI